MEDRLKSEWNGGEFKNLRIHTILQGISMSRHALQVSEWLLYLQDFSKELNGVKTAKEKIDLNDELKVLSEKINSYQLSKNNSHIRVKGVPADIIDSLNDFEDKLWDIFTKSGLEMRLLEDASKALR